MPHFRGGTHRDIQRDKAESVTVYQAYHIYQMVQSKTPAAKNLRENSKYELILTPVNM
jgi:hypothetical protein